MKGYTASRHIFFKTTNVNHCLFPIGELLRTLQEVQLVRVFILDLARARTRAKGRAKEEDLTITREIVRYRKMGLPGFKPRPRKISVLTSHY